MAQSDLTSIKTPQAKRLEYVTAKISQTKGNYLGKCGQCDREGFIASGKPCKCLEDFRKIVIAMHSGVPEEYLGYTLESYPGTEELKQNEKVVNVKKFVGHYLKTMTNKGLFFTGPYGVGKTSLQIICMRQFLETIYPKTGIYCTSSDLINSVGHGKHDYRDVMWALEEIKNTECLICDDLGKEYSVGYAGIEACRLKFGMVLDEILRYRLSRGLMTHFSSNFNATQLKTEYGESFTEIAKKLMKFVNFSADFPNIRNPEVNL